VRYRVRYRVKMELNKSKENFQHYSAEAPDRVTEELSRSTCFNPADSILFYYYLVSNGMDFRTL
jgi:hypothetical protein